VRVLQVLEATLGGTRRYLEDVFTALGGGNGNGLAYSLRRADAPFIALLESLRSAGWQLFEVDMRREISPLHDLQRARELQKIYRSFRPDVVHAHSSKAGALARIATIGMANRPRLVYTPHSIAANISRAYGLIEKILALRLDILMAVTESEREELGKLCLVPPLRMHVAVPTISGEKFVPRQRERARLELALGDEPLVIAIGRLSSQKDPFAFVNFVSALRTQVPDVRAIWVGDGDLRATVEQRITFLGLEECVTITGWLNDVRPYLAACDLFVSTSQYESFGYVTAEALAMERPVVASAINGTIDVVRTNVSEQLFQQSDIVGASFLAERFLREPEFAQETARRGRASVLETFSVSETRRGLHGAYNAALKN
jgi:glycosyltransferase involved in cell wall biosynthesis